MSDTDRILHILGAMQHELTSLREDQKQGFTEVNKRLDRIENDELHIHTALKVLPTKQDLEVTVEAAKSELKADLIRKIQRHERRIENLEDEAGIENPEKN